MALCFELVVNFGDDVEAARAAAHREPWPHTLPAGAQVGGVTAWTVWRWLETARTEGRAERRRRARLEVSDQAWEVLARAGGNVSVLYRNLKDAGGEVPSLASLYRVCAGIWTPGGLAGTVWWCGGSGRSSRRGRRWLTSLWLGRVRTVRRRRPHPRWGER